MSEVRERSPSSEEGNTSTLTLSSDLYYSRAVPGASQPRSKCTEARAPAAGKQNSRGCVCMEHSGGLPAAGRFHVRHFPEGGELEVRLKPVTRDPQLTGDRGPGKWDTLGD